MRRWDRCDSAEPASGSRLFYAGEPRARRLPIATSCCTWRSVAFSLSGEPYTARRDAPLFCPPHASRLTPHLDFVVVIPARYASTRLPGKPLLDIAGKPMVVHVAERAKASGAAEVCIATDDERILRAAQQHGHEAVMTRADHASGTDRLAEVAVLRKWADDRIVVNVQGDEPRIAPELIRDVAQILARRPQADMSTACHPIGDAKELFDPNCVKVVLDHAGDALYFSRATIPWARDDFARDRSWSRKDFRSIVTSESTATAALPAHLSRSVPACNRAMRSAGAIARLVARSPHLRDDHPRRAGGGRGHARGSRGRASAVRSGPITPPGEAV